MLNKWTKPLHWLRDIMWYVQYMWLECETGSGETVGMCIISVIFELFNLLQINYFLRSLGLYHTLDYVWLFYLLFLEFGNEFWFVRLPTLWATLKCKSTYDSLFQQPRSVQCFTDEPTSLVLKSLLNTISYLYPISILSLHSRQKLWSWREDVWLVFYVHLFYKTLSQQAGCATPSLFL